VTASLLLTSGFVIGAIFGNLLLLQYGFRSRWRETRTGHVLISLFAVIALSYDVSALALLFPDTFDGGMGLGVRIAARHAINVVLIALWLLLMRAQKADRGPTVEAFREPEDVRHPDPRGMS
jgi:hypothetical protein